jgi:hypothetical protein
MQEVRGSNPRSSTMLPSRSEGVSGSCPRPLFDLQSPAGAKWGANGHADLASFRWLKMASMVSAPCAITGRIWWRYTRAVTVTAQRQSVATEPLQSLPGKMQSDEALARRPCLATLSVVRIDRTSTGRGVFVYCWVGLSAKLISSARPNFPSRVNSLIGVNGAPSLR